MARSEELQKEKEQCTMPLNDYKIHVQSPKQEILKNGNMLRAIGANVSCLQEGKEKHKAENRS